MVRLVDSVLDEHGIPKFDGMFVKAHTTESRLDMLEMDGSGPPPDGATSYPETCRARTSLCY